MSCLTAKLETDVELKASAAQFHEVFWGRPHHISNVSPDKIQACELHDGEWGKVGSIICWNYVHDGEAKVAKEVIEAVDPDNNSITFRVIDGDLMKEYKSFVVKIDVTPKGEGSVAHWTLEYEKLHDAIAHPETLVDFCVEVSKELGEHLACSSTTPHKLETDVELKASAAQFHEVFWGRPHHISSFSPGKIHGVELLEGEWGKVGSVVNWSYTHDGEVRTAKEVVEAVDSDNNSITYKVIEGDLMKEYKSFTFKIDVTPKGEGSVAHWTMEYEKLHEGVDHPETLLELAVEVSKEIDESLTSCTA